MLLELGLALYGIGLIQNQIKRIPIYTASGFQKKVDILVNKFKYPFTKKYSIGERGHFGMRIHPIEGVLKMHEGIDIDAPLNEYIRAIADGVVLPETYDERSGNKIRIQHDKDWFSGYAHLNQIFVVPGQKVKQGQIIGTVGSTGMSTGPHLHLGIKYRDEWIDPEVIFA